MRLCNVNSFNNDRIAGCKEFSYSLKESKVQDIAQGSSTTTIILKGQTPLNPINAIGHGPTRRTRWTFFTIN